MKVQNFTDSIAKVSQTDSESNRVNQKSMKEIGRTENSKVKVN